MNSLAVQRCQDYEWIVVDGASTDNSLSIAQEFRAAPSRIVSEPDDGIYDAMNKAIGLATGDYLYFLNSDDAFYDDRVLEDMKSWFEQNPGTDLAYGNVVHVKGDGNWLRDFSHIGNRNILEEGICHQAIFARRALFSTIGTFDLRFKLNADYDWIIRVFRSNARCVALDRVVAFFSDGGAHSRDAGLLARERESVRLQYVRKRWLALRMLRARAYGRLYRILRGHPRGIARFAERGVD